MPTPDTDLISLLTGQLAELEQDVDAFQRSIMRNGAELQPAMRDRYAEAAATMDAALDALRCCRCSKLGIAVRGGVLGDNYCADHEGVWGTCDECHQDTLIDELGSPDGTTNLCPSCQDGSDDYVEDDA